MGQFFTNIQVSRGKSSPALDRTGLAKNIVTSLEAEGFREVSPPARGDRRIHISDHSDGEWLTVLDSATEGQDLARLDQTAAMISKIAEVATISILVHDGDRLQMGLFREGTKRALFDSWPGYFEGEPPAPSASGIAEWIEVLPAGKSQDDLQIAWTSERLDEGALPRLKRMAQLFGMDFAQCTLGADSLPPAKRSEYTTLIFSAERHGKERVALGLPALGYAGGLEATTRISVNELRSLTLIAHSVAAPASGLRAMVWGSAIDAGLIRAAHASLMIGEDSPPIMLSLESQLTSNEIVLAATAEASVPAGHASPGDAFAVSGGGAVNGMRRWLATRINFDLDLVGVKTGAGGLFACLEPLTNPESRALWTTTVQVTS